MVRIIVEIYVYIKLINILYTIFFPDIQILLVTTRNNCLSSVLAGSFKVDLLFPDLTLVLSACIILTHVIF